MALSSAFTGSVVRKQWLKTSHSWLILTAILTTIGNGKYHCLNCGHVWKKYRGRKPYERIKTIYAVVGGFPGPYFNVKVDIERVGVEHQSSIPPKEAILPLLPTREDIDWFISEMYKCDLMNWAEEYFMPVCDGTHWSVRIEYDTHCEIKTGSNHFPPKWTKFCKAISKLRGGEFC